MNRNLSKTYLILFVIIAQLFTSTSGAVAQDTIQGNDSVQKLFTPLLKGYPPDLRYKSGIHLGNRSGDWPSNTLSRLKGVSPDKWPTAVVVLSNQLYTINRSATGICAVTSASVRASTLYTYLTQAVFKGTKVIIRIYPSPGNFNDYQSPGSNHVLRSDTTPAGGNYCGTNSNKFRAIDDIVNEMNEIYKVNVNQKGWPVDGFYFEPANEPNNEWYSDYPAAVPNSDNRQAWLQMDAYFSALYDKKQQTNSTINILTPPMAQHNFAEKYIFSTCQEYPMNGGGSGYDAMFSTFNSKNDGYSLHNYWRYSKENWNEKFCPTASSAPESDHIYQYFPFWMQVAITRDYGTKFNFITEADLLSPCLDASNVLTNKDAAASQAANSIWKFISQERSANATIVWLLATSYQDLPDGSITSAQCADPNYEHAWHEAYRENGVRSWFTSWWSQNE